MNFEGTFGERGGEMPIISSFFSFHALIQCNRLLRRSAGNRKVRRTCSDYFITISILTGLVIVIQRTIPESANDDLNDAFASAVIPYELGEQERDVAMWPLFSAKLMPISD